MFLQRPLLDYRQPTCCLVDLKVDNKVIDGLANGLLTIVTGVSLCFVSEDGFMTLFDEKSVYSNSNK